MSDLSNDNFESVDEQDNLLASEPKTIESTQSASNPKKKLLCLMKTFILLLIICTLGVLIYFYFLEKNELKETMQIMQQLERNSSLNATRLGQQQEQINKQDTQIKALFKSRQLERRENSLYETLYLVEMAEFTLQFENDNTKTQELLNSALNRLVDLSDPNLEMVQNNINSLLSEVKDLPEINIEQTLIELNSLSEDVNNLPSLIQAPQQMATISQNTPEENQAGFDWKKKLKENWEKLKSIVVIKHHNQPITASQVEYEKVYLDQRLQFLLEQAQWSVLHRKPALYILSLTKAEEWLNKHYDPNSHEVKQFKSSISALISLNLNPKLPDFKNAIGSVQNQLQLDSQEHSNEGTTP